MKQEKGISLVVLILIIVILLVSSTILTYVVLSSKKSNITENKEPVTNSIPDIDNLKENDKNNVIEIQGADSVDSHKNLNLTYDERGAFLMTVEQVYTRSGHGTMVEGTILRGTIKTGDTVQILGMDEDAKTTTIARVEQSRTEISTGKIGDKVTVLLSDYERNEIIIGQVLAQENSILVSNNIEVSVQMNNDKNVEELKNLTNLKCSIRNIEVPIKINFNVEIEDSIINILLEDSIALEKEMKFTIKDDNSSIAECTIIKVY